MVMYKIDRRGGGFKNRSLGQTRRRFRHHLLIKIPASIVNSYLLVTEISFKTP